MLKMNKRTTLLLLIHLSLLENILKVMFTQDKPEKDGNRLRYNGPVENQMVIFRTYINFDAPYNNNFGGQV